jgi:hypothetical protein
MTTTIGALNVPLSMNTAAFVAGTQKARAELSSLAANSNRFLAVIDKSFTSTTVNITKMAREVVSLRGLLGAAGLGVGTAALTGFARAVVTGTAALVDEAKQVGVSIEALQAYRGVLQDSGGSAEVMDRILGKLSDRIGEAQAGSKEARERFMALGVSIDAVARVGANAESVFPLVARGAAAMAGETQRLNALNDLLGDKLGKYVVPAMGELSKSTADVIAQQKELNRVVAGDTARKMNDSVTKMGQAWEGLKNQAAPALSFITTELSHALWTANALAAALGKVAGHFSQGANMAMGTASPLDSKAWRTPGAADSSSPLPMDLPVANLDLPSGAITKSPLAGYRARDEAAKASAEAMAEFTANAQKQIAETNKVWFDGFHQRQEDDYRAWIEQMRYAREYQDLVSQGVDDAKAKRQAQNDEIVAHYQRMSEEMKQRQAEINRYVAMSAAENIVALGEAAVQGSKSFLRAMGQMILGVAQLIIKLQIAKAIESSLGSGGGGILNGIFSFLGGGSGILPGSTGLPWVNSYAGAYADGGKIPAGKWGIVGENGPERVDGPATVTPLDGGSAARVHIQVSLSEDLTAKVMRTSGAVVSEFSRSVLPNRVMEIANDSRRR